MLRRNAATAATSADSSNKAAASVRSRSILDLVSGTATTTCETKATTTVPSRIPTGILLLLFLLTTALTMAGLNNLIDQRDSAAAAATAPPSNEPNPSLRAGATPLAPSHSVGPFRNAARRFTLLRWVVYSGWMRLRAELGSDGGRKRKKKRPASAPVVDPSMEITIPLQAHLCPNTVRAGDQGDGGWWLCGADSAVGNDCVVYSFGIRENFSFDQYVAGRGCTVHGFDPSPAGLDSEAEYESIAPAGMGESKAFYHPYGLGNDGTYESGTVPFRWPGMGYLLSSNSNKWTLKTLPKIQTELKSDKITVLKVDIEGGEWDMMMDIIQADWDELCMELHFYPGYFYLFETDIGGLNIVEAHHATYQIQRPEQNVGSVSRIQLLKKLNEVADMFLWEPNGDDCVEVYFRRKQ